MLLCFQIFFPEPEGKWNSPGCQVLMAKKISYEGKKKKRQLNHHLIIFAYELLHLDQEFSVGRLSVNLGFDPIF